MRSTAVIAVISACLVTSVVAGCRTSAPAAGGTWRAFASNGDKPGIGIELVQRGSDTSGAMYILDPNHPGDFSTGRRCTMAIQRQTEHELYFSVRWLPTMREDLVLHVARPLCGKTFRGVLDEPGSGGAPRVYDFVQVE